MGFNAAFIRLLLFFVPVRNSGPCVGSRMSECNEDATGGKSEHKGMKNGF